MDISVKSLKQWKAGPELERVVILVSVNNSSPAHIRKQVKILGEETARRLEGALLRLPEAPKFNSEIFIGSVESGSPDLHLFVLPEDTSAFSLLTFSRGVVKSSLLHYVKSYGVIVLDPKVEVGITDAITSAAAARVFAMPEYGRRLAKRKPFQLKTMRFFVSKPQEKLAQAAWLMCEGTNLVRSLGMLPPNELNPVTYGDRIRKLAKENKFQVKFYSNLELKKMGAGAFTAVDRGNPQSKGGIYELTYAPSKAKNKQWVTFVGKGLCFDTGGYDIKTQGYMVTMKGDMQGSALALANLITAAKLKLPLKMKAYLAVTENLISPVAYRPDEVVTALNGLTIEVINTDAEGRMVLADTLALASRGKPELIMNFATLTGMANYAIGQNYSAGFTNRERLHSKIIEAGRRSGERVWTFPLDKDYAKALESPIADILQCTKGRSPDHIMAAYFLNLFVEKEIDWIHIDMSAADKEGGLAHVDTVFTGFGVRWSMQFLKDRYKV